MKDTLKIGGVKKEMKAQVMPFDTSLWSYVHKAAEKHSGHMSSETGKSLLHHTYKHHRALQAREAEVAPTKMLSRHIKMMSLNPSVYGNIYSPLGTS
jgi:hypothetical protein